VIVERVDGSPDDVQPGAVVLGGLDRVALVERAVAERALEDEHDLVPAAAVTFEDVLEHRQQAERRHVGAEFLAQLARDGLAGALARLDPAAERTVVVRALDAVEALEDEDLGATTHDTDGDRTDPGRWRHPGILTAGLAGVYPGAT
jgi:hypothetical protein